MKKKKTEGLNSAELSNFCSQVALILNAGMPLYDGMSTLAEGSRDLEHADVYMAVSKAVDETGSLYKALEQGTCWPSYMVEMVGIGEQTGHLEEVMKGLATYYEREDRIRTSIVSAITYPLVLGALLMVIVFIMIMKVLPIFTQVLHGMGISISETGTSLMRVGEIIGLVVLIVVGLVLTCVLIIAILLQTRQREKVLDFLRRALPPVRRISRKLSAARIAGVLSMMISSGFPLEEALRMAPKVLTDENSIKKVEQIREGVSAGENFGEALSRAELFDQIHNRMVKMGVASGKEDEVMARVAAIYEEQIDESISHMISIVEPTLVALLAIVIGAVLLTVMLPMTGILSSIL
ncbi:MAG: hypothetical protein CW338_01235 [Clostridiales bacterium]|nr:hypothetical protein [Clostridiales bacterium]